MDTIINKIVGTVFLAKVIKLIFVKGVGAKIVVDFQRVKRAAPFIFLTKTQIWFL